jgi:hypothetical protein
MLGTEPFKNTLEMKKILQILLLLSPILLAGQNHRWEVIHGSQNRNEGIGSIMEDYDKGLLIGGSSWIGWFGDAWGFKTDINGNQIYDKIFSHGEYTLKIDDIAIDANGNKYLCGTYYDEHTWPFIIKLDSCGKLVWCNELRDANFTYGFSQRVLVTKNNHVLLLTYFANIQNPIEFIHIIAFDISGNTLWKRPYASKNDYPLLHSPVAIDFIEFNRCYYISGECYYPFPNNPNHVFRRPMFIGIDSLFNEKFVLPFMKRDSIFGSAHSFIQLNDSILMGVGYNFLPPDFYEVTASLMLINTDGEEVELILVTNDDISPDIVDLFPTGTEKINDSVMVMSAFYGNIGGNSPFGEIIFDMSGRIHKYRYDSAVIAGTIIKTSDDNYVVGGNIIQNNILYRDIILYKMNDSLESVPFDTTQRVYDSLCPRTIQSGSIDLYECLTVVNIGELPSPQEYYESIRWIPIKAYPNPVTEGKLTLEFDNTRHHQNMELHCYDNFGRLIHSRKIYNGQQDTVLDVSTWPPGIYIAVVYSDGSARGKVKFVVR